MSQATLEQLQSRIEALESQLTFQEDIVEQLNAEITNLNLNQQTMLRQITLLAEKVTSQKGSIIAPDEEETPPPHY